VEDLAAWHLSPPCGPREEYLTVKALVLKEYLNLVYEDVPDPQIGPEDVLNGTGRR